MNIISSVAAAMQTVLTSVADSAAKTSGFIKRTRKLTGATFVQTLVFSWLANPDATYSEMSQTAAAVGVNLTPSAIEQRFTQEAAETLKEVLDASVAQMIDTEQQTIPLLCRFNGVYLADSSWVAFPDELASQFKGTGGTSGGLSSAKIQLRWELTGGTLEHLCLTDGKTNDKSAEISFNDLPPGSLHLADLGYFSLADLDQKDADGIFWLTKIPANTGVFDANANRIELADWLKSQPANHFESQVWLGCHKKLACRLLMTRVSQEDANKRRRQIRAHAKKKGRTPSQARLHLAAYNILVTNVSDSMLSVSEAFVLYRIRWQIELLFKLWKSHGGIDKSQSHKKWRILTEFYAKLIAMIHKHWILLCGGIVCPYHSLTKATKAVKKHALHIAIALASADVQQLIEALEVISTCLAQGSRIMKRKNRPSAYQILSAICDDSQQ